MSHVTHMSESHHTHERVMSHTQDYIKYEETWKGLEAVEQDAVALAALHHYCVTQFFLLTKRPVQCFRYARECVGLLYRFFRMDVGPFYMSLFAYIGLFSYMLVSFDGETARAGDEV